MKKTILIGALLLGTLAQASMKDCTSAVNLMKISLDMSIEAHNKNDFKGACGYIQLANSFVEDAMVKCPAELQTSLRGAYIQGKQMEVIICNKK